MDTRTKVTSSTRRQVRAVAAEQLKVQGSHPSAENQLLHPEANGSYWSQAAPSFPCLLLEG